MGRKRSDKEDARNKPTPKRSKPVDMSITSVQCPDCGGNVMKSNATGNIQRHYIPTTDGTRKVCGT